LSHCSSNRILRPHCFGIQCNHVMELDIWHHVRSLSPACARFGDLADVAIARIEHTTGSEPILLSLVPAGLRCSVCLENRPALLRNCCNHAACESCWSGWAEANLPMLEERQILVPACFAIGCGQPTSLPIWQHTSRCSDAVRIFARDMASKVERLRNSAARVLAWPCMSCEPGLICMVCLEPHVALISNAACAHAACEGCWSTWIETQLPNCRGQRCAGVRCIGPECGSPTVPAIWQHTCTISRDVQSLDEIFAKRLRLQANRLFPAEMQVECPRAECLGLAYQGFDTLMCFFCEHQWTDDAGVTPSVTIGDDLVTELGMKQCPRCQVNIQKSGGCNHMKCRCGHEFFWDTLLPYRT